VIRRRLKAGEVLFRQGDAGNTAFLIKSGRLGIRISAEDPQPKRGLFRGPGQRGRDEEGMDTELTPAALIVGEMACMSGSPRTATVAALEDTELWELRRNVLDRLMRLPSLKGRFEAKYRERILDLALRHAELFDGIDDVEFKRIVDYLRPRITFVRVNPGQILFRQGDQSNAMYLIRLGHGRVGVQRFGGEVRVLSRGPGTILGEIGLLALSPRDIRRSPGEVDEALKNALDRAGNDIRSAIPPGDRNATCSALTQLELARLSRADFLQMVRDFPLLRRRLVEHALSDLRSDVESTPLLSEYVAQGLYEGQSILALDMDLCTRCDECTRGCVQQHGTASHGVPVTRMLRDGLRFANYTIATACRSCVDPHCMEGCPVDAIHRGKHLQIVIEDHCIGCGLCASNCPYGNISMVPNQLRRFEAPDQDHPGASIILAQPKAVTCDLCDAEGRRSTPEPRCVSSCPHGAASRVSGEELLRRVLKGESERH
jgi:CRP-like cAMP-binding protein/Fe-S-cluster-containing hydrogenase component 2